MPENDTNKKTDSEASAVGSDALFGIGDRELTIQLDFEETPDGWNRWVAWFGDTPGRAAALGHMEQYGVNVFGYGHIAEEAIAELMELRRKYSPNDQIQQPEPQ